MSIREGDRWGKGGVRNTHRTSSRFPARVSGCTAVLVTKGGMLREITFEGRQMENSQSVSEVPLGHKDRERDAK